MDSLELPNCSCRAVFRDGKARTSEEMEALLINTEDYRMLCVCDVPPRAYSAREKPITVSGVIQRPQFTQDSTREHFGFQTYNFSLWHFLIIFVVLVALVMLIKLQPLASSDTKNNN